MGSFIVVTNTVLVGLGGLANWLCGCAHRETTFPITLRTRVGLEGQPSAQLETYVVCLGCGRHLSYDWSTMSVTRRWAVGARRCLASSALVPEGDTPRMEQLLPQAASGFGQEARANRGSQ